MHPRGKSTFGGEAMRRTMPIAAILALSAAAIAQTPARDQLARGKALWQQRLSKSAIAALEIAARDKETAAEAHEALGRIYTYKGWLQDNVLPGWHDEPSLRDRALARSEEHTSELQSLRHL